MKMKERDDKEKQINEAENVDVNPAEQINVTSSPDTAESHERHTSTVQQNSACNQLITEATMIVTSMWDKSLFSNCPFLIFCAANFIIFLWQGITYLYLVDQAILFNIQPNRAAFLLSVIGIARTV